ncbi:capsid cement protein [Gordonia sp. NB41Y]|uniref:capsid cement protein n=1 Tax=Gordonia sp. NB41Y TaxID=875808 RepID=UPI0002BE6CDC|nr:capsid cement protein [Gordonia sp. NB41Y]EMP10154.1 hypothetical protein ISGA_4203 [Gordonia sp. NB41Y]WLP90250.1 DUF2190 family protein [Gordonia sp. NB41Y]
MAEHTPKYLPGAAITFRASANVTGGQLVEITGNETVGPAAAKSAKAVGVAAFDAKSSELVTVHTDGVHRLTAAAAVAAGASVEAAASGGVQTNTDGAVVGLALAAASGGKVLVKLR